MPLSLRRGGPANDLAVLHDEIDLAQVFDVIERVGGHCHQVSAQVFGDAAAHFVDPQQLRRIAGHGAQNIGGRDARPSPPPKKNEKEGGPPAPPPVAHPIPSRSHTPPPPIPPPGPL